MEAQRITVTEFGTVAYPDPCKSLFSRFFSYFTPSLQQEMSDNCNVNILPFKNDECYVATETPLLRKFDPSDLHTQDKLNLSKLVSVNLATAHPHFEEDGTMYNMGSSFEGGPKYCVIKVPPSGKSTDGAPHAFDKASIIATIRGQFKASPCYYHSFGMTKNHIILLEQPFYINVLKVMANQFMKKPVAGCFEYRKDLKTKIHVVRKDTGEILPIKFTAPAVVCFHHINAYEESGQIVLDFCDVVDYKAATNVMLDHLRKVDGSTVPGTPRRFVLPLTVKEGAEPGENLVAVDSTATSILQTDGSVECTGEILCDPGFDLPTINYWKSNGKKYKFFYGSGVLSNGIYKNSILKHDIEQKITKTWKGSNNMFTSEPIFVPSPIAKDEDDGIVLCGISDVTPNTPDFLLILDGKSFKEIARAEVPEGIRIPYGFHGQFLERC